MKGEFAANYNFLIYIYIVFIWILAVNLTDAVHFLPTVWNAVQSTRPGQEWADAAARWPLLLLQVNFQSVAEIDKTPSTAWNRPTWKVMVVVPSCSHWRALKRRDTLYSRLWSRADRAQVFGSLWVIGHDANLFLFGVQCIYPPSPSLHKCNILLSFVSELLLANPSPSTIFSPAQWQDIPVSESSNVDEIQCPILHNPFLSCSHKLKGTVTHFVKKKKNHYPDTSTVNDEFLFCSWMC